MQEYKVSAFDQRLMNEIEYRLESMPPINEDPEDGVFENIPESEKVKTIFLHVTLVSFCRANHEVFPIYRCGCETFLMHIFCLV